MVSALSQLWIFGLYELLRTWRQRVRQVIEFTCELAPLNKNDREERISTEVSRLWTPSMGIDEEVAPIPVQVFEDAVRRDGFAKQLELDFVRAERAFKKIEVLRISLAKHELPREHGSYCPKPEAVRSRMDTIQSHLRSDGRRNDRTTSRTRARGVGGSGPAWRPRGRVAAHVRAASM